MKFTNNTVYITVKAVQIDVDWESTPNNLPHICLFLSKITQDKRCIKNCKLNSTTVRLPSLNHYRNVCITFDYYSSCGDIKLYTIHTIKILHSRKKYKI